MVAQPIAYVLDTDPAKSYPLAQREARACECGQAIPMSDGMFQASQCLTCEVAMDDALEIEMLKQGHTGGWPIYWTVKGRVNSLGYPLDGSHVGTFHGHKTWRVLWVRVGNHNIARRQYSLQWQMSDGSMWAGTVYGNNTQLVRNARKLKRQG